MTSDIQYFKDLVKTAFPDFDLKRSGLAVREDLNQRLGTDVQPGSLYGTVEVFVFHLENYLKK
ncbi:MAG: hypothetical protein ABFD50_07930 [Smithella sp.]